MSCEKPCLNCDCGEAMNDLDSSPTLAVATGLPACVDCGERHLPRPCIECINCSRLFTTDHMHIDGECQWWCDSCFTYEFFPEIMAGTPAEEEAFLEHLEKTVAERDAQLDLFGKGK